MPRAVYCRVEMKMIRIIAICNESILRGSLSNKSRTRVILRHLTTQAAHEHQIYRLLDVELKRPKQVSVWSTNCVRAYTSQPHHIINWGKKEGNKLNKSNHLAETETENATMGLSLDKILGSPEKKDVPNENLAPAAAPASAFVVAQPSGSKVYDSPMARNLAEALRLRLEGKGREKVEFKKSKDVGAKKAAVAAPSTAPQRGSTYIDIPVSNIRGIIAKRLRESKQNPHYYMTVECKMDNLMKFREEENKKLEKQNIKVSVNDFILKATANAIRKLPQTNCSWLETVIRQFENVDISVAVTTDRGLIAPIVLNADKKGVIEISKEIKSLAAKARENKLKPHEFQGGTVTVTNLGMYGVHHFSAALNPPQSMIVAVGATTKRLVADQCEENGFREETTLAVTLSADHRSIDGDVGATWLQHFRKIVEDPKEIQM